MSGHEHREIDALHKLVGDQDFSSSCYARVYPFAAQESGIFCVPAVIQMTLLKRGIVPDHQHQIFNELGTHVERVGTIDSYLQMKAYGLSCKDYPAEHSFSRDFDLLAREALACGCDIIVDYANGVLHGTPSASNHVSLISLVGEIGRGTQPGCETILTDPLYPPDGLVRVAYADLERAMFHAGGGLHLIHEERDVLERLVRDYP